MRIPVGVAQSVERRSGHTLRLSGVSIPRWLVGVCLLVSVAGIFNHELWTPDEPREAAVILAMQHPAPGLVPQLAGEPFVEKPPLYYLLSSFWLRLGGAQGRSAGWLRLSSALWGLGTLGLTFLLARRLYGHSVARLALVILATLPGFIHVTHWLLVDNALMFFLVAAFWALTAAYQVWRPGYLLLAGLFAAAAFLVKGLVGPLLIGLGWLGLVLPWWRDSVAAPCAPPPPPAFPVEDRLPANAAVPPPQVPTARTIPRSSVLAFHLLAALVFLAPVLAWAALFYASAGRALFMEWFWTNHVGRFSGAAQQLGHQSGPWYYFGALPLYVLPWLAVLACGIGSAAGKLRARVKLPLDLALPLAWGLGGLLLLTLSATKREIYLSALLPALALLAARTLRRPQPRWAALAQRGWGLLLLLASGAALLETCWLAHPRIADSRELLTTWGWIVPVLLALGAGVVVWNNRRLSEAGRTAGLTALCAIALLTMAGPALERWKNYAPAFTLVHDQLQARPALQVAAWNLDETTRAGFFWYAGRIFPALRTRSELQAVLRGEGAPANAVLLCRKTNDALPPELEQAAVVCEVPMGSRRTLLLLQGLPPR